MAGNSRNSDYAGRRPLHMGFSGPSPRGGWVGGENWPGGQDPYRYRGAWGADQLGRLYRSSAGIGGQQGHYGKGPKGYTRSDDRIREDVNDRLTDDWHIDASNTEVQVSKGEVTLTGTVNSREEKHRAEDLADRCFGVKHVQNNLRVYQGDERGKQQVDRPGFDLGGASKEGRTSGIRTIIPGGPRS